MDTGTDADLGLSVSGSPNCTARQALTGVMNLIRDGDLVRNIENDGNVMLYMKQGLRIALALKKAEEAMGEALPVHAVTDVTTAPLSPK